MRLSGHFVAVATLGFLVIVRVVLFNADAFTRGSRTFSNVTPYTNLWWTAAWALLVGLRRVADQALARTAARCSPSARTASPPRRSGSGSWTRGCSRSSSGRSSRPSPGSLYAHFITSFSPTVFYFDLTFRVITMLVIGGMGSVSGSILGAILIVGLSEGAAPGRGRDPALRPEPRSSSP